MHKESGNMEVHSVGSLVVEAKRGAYITLDPNKFVALDEEHTVETGFEGEDRLLPTFEKGILGQHHTREEPTVPGEKGTTFSTSSC
ncbi:hypothetical protein L6452_15232 [Arctium lappa]|uniref:Uncharacterized protein n=1 Tax=Arctium lappa TaxID=4217 RepID=A0ACB9CN70_ARCLA|nr:hypothetical protein L6452_15232 [Arctium lappa]